MSINYLQPQQNQQSIIIINGNNPINDDIAPDYVKKEPQNAVEYLSQDDLESKARLNFIKKVYMILICK